MTKPAYLMLDDGSYFEGTACGATGESAGELVFNTSMTAYQENLTDPSLSNQILVFTSAHIGNYGVNHRDSESNKIHVSGVVIHELFPDSDSYPFPHWWAEASLDAMLKSQGIVGIKDVDTRALTLHLRDKGVKKGIISSQDLDKASLYTKVQQVPDHESIDFSSWVGTEKSYTIQCKSKNFAKDKKRPHLAVLDLGIRSSTLKSLSEMNLDITIFPSRTSAENILSTKPHGIFISSGPGDPKGWTNTLDEIKKLIHKIPVFGIGLGHQLIALAMGANTIRLKNGHHGANYPIKDLNTEKIYLSSQNNSFTVDLDSLPKNLKATFINCNDASLEGMRATDAPIFSVQFYPDSYLKAQGTSFLFEEFYSNIYKAMEGKI